MTQELDFDTAFQRLTQILDKMNAAGVGLEEALSLYEEADKLLALCQDKLGKAEAKVHMLIKKRGQLELGPDGQPLSVPFKP